MVADGEQKGKEVEQLDFYIRLLVSMEQFEQYPFTRMIIQNGLNEEEYQELLRLLERLNAELVNLKHDGMMDFTKLLIHFAGMLNVKLHPDEVMDALISQQMYVDLMKTFKHIKAQKLF
ncbi:hypothetical protein N781_14835 [Pontibacillus halophilus JSM 076056 = DSM 19796]|uniref:DUF1878 domain-containing protein n=1 Tax=Pontibacillus halophilus JSM 076056 = DSM 19796 TaxID=1385510 RepID=A0A0A5GKV6_9BACI|nr:hypothetical protein N781_14835 [Pontibacillus halophilus JSM 076056 = DSM 19796]